MTQAMPPAQPISFGPASAPGSARKSESQEDFSDTLRDQLEDKPQEQTAESTSTSQTQPGQDQGGEDNEAMNIILEGTQDVVVVVEQPLAVQRTDVAIIPVESQPPAAQVAEPSETREVVPAVSNAQPASAAVASVAVPAQFASPLRAAAGRTPGATSPAASLGDGPEQAFSVVPPAQSDAAPVKIMLLHNFARLTEVTTPASTQVAAITPFPALAATGTGTQGSVPASPLPLVVDTPLSNPGWGNAMAARLVWGATQGMQSVSIEVNPRDLGPVSVNMRIAGEEASITFVSQHALVREAVEAALPRLRELFSGDGINLGEVDISSGEGRSGNGGDAASTDDQHASTQADPRAKTLVTSSAGETSLVLPDSLVDTFA